MMSKKKVLLWHRGVVFRVTVGKLSRKFTRTSLETWKDANDDSTITWFNWKEGEPNDYEDGEDYVTMILTDENNDTLGGSNGLWNDVKSDSKNSFICSRDVIDPRCDSGLGYKFHTTSEGDKCLQV